MSVRLAWYFFLLGVLPGLITCSSGTEPTPTPQPHATAIALSAPDSVLTRGQVVQYTATLLDSAGTPIAGGSFTWSSVYPAIAGVAADGTAIGIDVGDTRVVVTASGLTASAPLQVRDTVISQRIDFRPWTPFGLAVHGSRAFATLLNIDSVVRIDIPGFTTSGGAGTGQYPTAAAFNAAGTRAYIANQDGLLTVLDPVTMSVVDTARYRGGLTSVLASEADRIWVTVGDRDTLYAIDPNTLQVFDSGKTAAGPNWIAKSPTLPRLYVNGSASGAVYELNSQTLDSIRGWTLGGAPQGMAVSADGATLFIANEGGWLDRIALGTGTVAPRVALGDAAFGLALSPDGSRLAVCGGFGGRVTLLSTLTLSTIRTHYSTGIARRLEFTSDGTHLVMTNESGWVYYIR